jgi:hypothetical protein
VAEVIVVVVSIGWLTSQAEGGVDVRGGSEGEWVVAREVDRRQDGYLYRRR